MKPAAYQKVILAVMVLVGAVLLLLHLSYYNQEAGNRLQTKNKATGASFSDAPAPIDSHGSVNEPASDSIGHQSLHNAIAFILRNLDKAENQGRGYNYWPEGGIRITYDNLRTFISYGDIQELSPFPIFISGPHSKDSLKLSDRIEFGHYNPDFCLWVGNLISEILKDTALVQSTKPLVYAYLRYTATLFWDTYVQLEKHSKESDFILDDYRQGIVYEDLEEGFYRALAWDYSEVEYAYGMQNNSKRFSFLQNLDAKGYDRNVVSSAVYFWMRRRMDGTAMILFEMLDNFVQAYDLN